MPKKRYAKSGGVAEAMEELAPTDDEGVGVIGKGRTSRYRVAGRGLGASGKTPADSTEEKAEPVAISVVELAPTQNFLPGIYDGQQK